MESVLAYLGTGCYAAAALLAVAALRWAQVKAERIVTVLVVAGALLLGAVLAARGVREAVIPAFSWFEALTFYSVMLTAVYLVFLGAHRGRGLAGFVLPYVFLMLACALPAISAGDVRPPPVNGGWLALHVTLAFAAYALLSLAGLLAVAYLVQDRNLKHKRMGLLWERLPALETLDNWIGRQVGFGFVLLTGAMILGITMVWRNGRAEEWLADPKIGASAMTWILFAVLVHMRASSDRHGRLMAVVTVCGLLCVLFAFVGVQLVTESVHGFVQILPPYGPP